MILQYIKLCLELDLSWPITFAILKAEAIIIVLGILFLRQDHHFETDSVWLEWV